MNDICYDLAISGMVLVGGVLIEDGIVWVRNGRIEAITCKNEHLYAKKEVGGRGKLILPGVIDSHVHSLSYPGEGFSVSTLSAAAGGVTTLIDMPVDAPSGIATCEALSKKIELLEKDSFIDVGLLGSVKNETLGQIPELKSAGVCGFKLSLFDTDRARFPRVKDGHLLEAFELIRETGLTAGIHAENDEIIKYRISKSISQDRTTFRQHLATRPEVSETESVLKGLEIARAAGVRLHLYHISCSRSIDLAGVYRKEGYPITIETCPHYLVLNEEDIERLGPRSRINPPVRGKEESDRLWKSIGKGEIDCVSSDHVGWPLELKTKPSIFDTASGAPGVETLLPLLYSEGVARKRISLYTLASVLSERPAKIFGLFPRKGILIPGADADFVVFDPQERWTVKAEHLHTSCDWTPYEGKEITGKVETTIVRGQIVWHKGQTLGQKGFGTFVRPNEVNHSGTGNSGIPR